MILKIFIGKQQGKTKKRLDIHHQKPLQEHQKVKVLFTNIKFTILNKILYKNVYIKIHQSIPKAGNLPIMLTVRTQIA